MGYHCSLEVLAAQQAVEIYLRNSLRYESAPQGPHQEKAQEKAGDL